MAITQDDTPQAPGYIGASLPRVEDARFLTGRAKYIDDLELPGMCHAVMLRSPHAHARILGIETGAATALDGVLGVFAGADLLPHVGSYVTAIWREGIHHASRRVLPVDRVRHVGEAVAVVVAESPYVAEDARDLIEVEYEVLDPVLDPEAALDAGSTIVDPDMEHNNLAHMEETCGDVRGAFADADRVFSGRFHQGRSGPVPIETKGVLAEYDAATGGFTIWTGAQHPHGVRALLAGPLGVPESKLRVITPAVGGGFGGKGFVTVEEAIVPALARILGRPVKWIEDRWEHLTASMHAKENVMHHEIAVRDDGTFLAFRARYLTDSGAFSVYPQSACMEGLFAATMLPGIYAIRGAEYSVDHALTTKCQVGAYRGIGWTAGQTAREVLIDDIAHELGIDPVELRLKNCIPSAPYTTVLGMEYDGGSYAESIRKACDLVGYDELRARQQGLREQGRYLGIGVSPYVEATGFGSKLLEKCRFPYVVYDLAAIAIQPDGSIVVKTGLQSHGQGLETVLAQVAADALGARFEDVTVLMGDTETSVYGSGTHSSRSAVTGGGTILRAARDLREKLVRLAAEMLEASPDDIEMRDGSAMIKGSPASAKTIGEIASFAYWDLRARDLDVDPDLTATRFYDPPQTFANGTVVAVVEVDVETGVVDLQRIVSVKDCGTMLNPMIVEGQVAGAVVQGVGCALFEEFRYDDDGQLLNDTLTQYLLPSAMDVPDVEVEHIVTPSPVTEGGIKGMGEGGMVGTPAAVANAVADALRPFGVHVDRTPLSPPAVLELLDAARRDRDG